MPANRTHGEPTFSANAWARAYVGWMGLFPSTIRAALNIDGEPLPQITRVPNL